MATATVTTAPTVRNWRAILLAVIVVAAAALGISLGLVLTGSSTSSVTHLAPAAFNACASTAHGPC